MYSSEACQAWDNTGMRETITGAVRHLISGVKNYESIMPWIIQMVNGGFISEDVAKQMILLTGMHSEKTIDGAFRLIRIKKPQLKLQMNIYGTVERRQEILDGLLQTGLADIPQVDFDSLSSAIVVNMQIGNALKEADRNANLASPAFEDGKGPEQDIEDNLNSYFYFDSLLELMGADASANGLIFYDIPLNERDGKMYRFRANAWKHLQKHIGKSQDSYENSIYSDKELYNSQILRVREQIQEIFEKMQGRYRVGIDDTQPGKMIYLLFTNLSKSMPLYNGMYSCIHLDYLNKIKLVVIQSIVENLITVEEAKALILLSGRVSIEDVNKFLDSSEIEIYRGLYS